VPENVSVSWQDNSIVVTQFRKTANILRYAPVPWAPRKLTVSRENATPWCPLYDRQRFCFLGKRQQIIAKIVEVKRRRLSLGAWCEVDNLNPAAVLAVYRVGDSKYSRQVDADAVGPEAR